MTRLLKFISRNPIALGALALTLATRVVHAQVPQCSLATLKGTYVMTATGTSYSGNPPQAAALGLVGKVVYDGKGNGQLIQTLSFAGTIYPWVTATGTYTVNSACTGSKSFTSNGVTSHFDFVVTPSGLSITFVETDSGIVLTGTAVHFGL